MLWRAISGRGDAFVVQGGFPLTVDGRVVGAIGVATGAHEHDSEIAQAGVRRSRRARLDACERHCAERSERSRSLSFTP